MAIELAAVYLPITPSLRGAGAVIQRELSGVNVAPAGQSIGGSIISGIGTAIKGTAAVVGTVAAATIGTSLVKGFARLDAIDTARAKLTGLGTSAETTAVVMDNALAAVKGTAFGLGDAATVAAQLVAAQIQPGEQLQNVLKSVANSAAAAGTGIGDMGSIYAKVASLGKAQNDVLQQVAERGLPIYQKLAEQFGVTTDEIFKMASDGKIGFADFEKAMTSAAGTVATEMGNTVGGSWANFIASLGRVGANLTGGLFPKIAPAIQAMTTALGPLEAIAARAGEALGTWLGPAIDNVTQKIAAFDFTKIESGVIGVYNLIAKGDFSNKFREAFALEEDSRAVTVILGIRNAIVGLSDLVVNGNFSTALRDAFNIEEDSGFVTFVLGARDAVGSFFSSLTSGDFSGAAASIGASLQTLSPALSEFGAQLPKVGQAAAKITAGGIDVLTQVLSFLADNVDTIIQFMPLIVAGFIAWRVASVAVANATLALRAGELAATPVYLANNIMRNNSVRIERQLALAKVASTGATNTATAATSRGTIATIASGTAARVAAAGQWVLNAALRANPIGIIITAITVLVGALIWFFTQTELGQAIWGEFSRFLGEAWTNIVNVATTVFTALGNFFTDLWNGIVSVVTTVWNNVAGFLGPIFDFIATLIRVYVETWVNIILVMAAVLVTIWNGVVAVVTDVWNRIVAFLTPIIDFIVNLVVGYFTGLWNFWSMVWQGVVDFFTGIWNGLISFLVPIVATVIGAVQGPVQALSDWWNGVWSTISSFFSDIWNGMVEAVGTAIGQITGFVGGIYDIVMNALSGAGEWLLNAGADVVRGFWEGISGMGDWLFKQIGGFFDGVIGWAKDTLGIASPSKVFRAEVGQMVGEGMALGIGDSESAVQHAMDSLLTVPAVPASPAMVGDAYAPSVQRGVSASGGITQNNHFEHMDPRVAVDLTNQGLAAVARRVRPA